LRIYSCFIHMNERVLHNFVTVLADYDNHPAERAHLRLGPVGEVADGKPARWLDVSEERLDASSDLFGASMRVQRVCGCSDVRCSDARRRHHTHAI